MSDTTCPHCGHESLIERCPRCYRSKGETSAATETCPTCGGHGWAAYMVTFCPECKGRGRVPVPLRGVTDPTDEDHAQELLERKVGVAMTALELLAKWPESTPEHPSITSQDIAMRAFAKGALEKLSK